MNARLFLSRNHVSCGWPEPNLKSEIADAIRDFVCGAAWITVGEMIGPEVLVASAISQHVVGGDQDRCCDGNGSFLRAAACV